MIKGRITNISIEDNRIIELKIFVKMPNYLERPKDLGFSEWIKTEEYQKGTKQREIDMQEIISNLRLGDVEIHYIEDKKE